MILRSLTRHPRWTAYGSVVLIWLALFGDVLFFGNGRLFSDAKSDLTALFAYQREFGFGELARGNVALWNPHLFSGSPFFGGFVSALFYPPNAMFLCLPLHAALNWSLALHVLLAGLFTTSWAAQRRLGWAGRVLAGTLAMLSGPLILRIHAGHLVHLCTLAWAPLVFLAVDGLIARFRWRWVLLGAFAVAMQVLAGFPQFFLYTGYAAAIYAFARIALDWRERGARGASAAQRMRPLAGLALVYALGVGLGAVQFLTGMEAGRGGVRARADFEFASSFSLPPENLLTLLFPMLLGDQIAAPYWGRWFLWEVFAYGGAAAFVLALYGALAGRKAARRGLAVAALICIVLALGSYTPLFALLYEHAPGFDRVRCIGRFVLFADLFVAMLAGVGIDRLLRAGARERLRRNAVALAAAGLAVAAAIGALITTGEHRMPTVVQAIQDRVVASGEMKIDASTYALPGFRELAAERARLALWWGAAILALAAAGLWLAGRRRGIAVGLGVLALFEVFGVAFHFRTTHDPAKHELARGYTDFLAQHAKDGRVLSMLGDHDRAMAVGYEELWGYGTELSRRYAELIAFTQGEDPDRATEYVKIRSPHRIFRLLRLEYLVGPAQPRLPMSVAYEDEQRCIYRLPDPPLPRAFLVDRWRRVAHRDEAFAALAREGFEPEREVLLEVQPPFASSAAGGEPPGSVEAEVVDTDTLRLRVHAKRAGVVVVTNSYRDGFVARDSAGADFSVVPADHALLGIFVPAGEHDLRLEYAPASFRIGAWISALTVALVAAGAVLLARRRRRESESGQTPFQLRN